jgi:hypothetical protein
MLIRMSVVVVALLAWCGAATGAGMPAPAVDYTAVREIVSEQGSFKQRVHASKGMERTEMQMGGMSMVSIIRPDRKLVWSLMPAQRMYQEVSIEQARRRDPGVSDPQIEISKLGQETVDGIAATKYRLILKNKSGGGFVWLTGENIPIKMEFISREGGAGVRVGMRLREVKTGRLDPALFEIPAGYTRMPSMGGLGTGMLAGSR